MSGPIAANPFEVPQPKNLGLGQLAGTMSALVKHIAWELGERYDATLRVEEGADWLDRLAEQRGERLSLHDPAFVFGEAEHYAQSPLWRALPPRSPGLVDLFRRARVTRNRWEHDTAQQDAGTFKQGVQRYAALGHALDVPWLEECAALVERVDTLMKGGPLPETTLVDEMRERVDAAEAERQRAEDEAAEARAMAEREGADREAAEAQAKAAAEAAELARREAEELRRQIEAAEERARVNRVEPGDDLEPGSPWPEELGLGQRRLVLKTRLMDLYDPAKQILLSDELGEVAREAARRWAGMLAHDCDVHLTPAGHACAGQGLGYVYLGRLDEVTREFTAGATARGEFRPGSYEISEDGELLDAETGQPVGDPDAMDDYLDWLEQGLIPHELFRVTEDGIVATRRGRRWIQIVKINADGWL
jgi:hypothetical protein